MKWEVFQIQIFLESLVAITGAIGKLNNEN
jgi:hypothetical protein